ncbi:hypothetical protein N431DRAFT_497296 [Stipitochalara longipes BDJ]|nr:hypothetical protein N431DRAFT_497296 [Stipitochalara longipes BDJ]
MTYYPYFSLFKEWKTNTNLFLKINGYISYINGTETSPNKELYYKVVNKLDNKGKVTSSREEPISPKLGIRYTDQLSEYNRNSKRALGILKSIILINNNERFKNKDKPNELYTTITSTFSIPKPIMAWLILKGLPSSYDNYTS